MDDINHERKKEIKSTNNRSSKVEVERAVHCNDLVVEDLCYQVNRLDMQRASQSRDFSFTNPMTPRLGVLGCTILNMWQTCEGGGG